ncbi:hypothetical protein [Micromonospora sp. NPDC005197]
MGRKSAPTINPEVRSLADDLGRNFDLRADERSVYEMVRCIDYLLGDDD